jgi:hypothetical protein
MFAPTPLCHRSTTFDHTKPYVRELWLNTLLNATKLGSVGGV